MLAYRFDGILAARRRESAGSWFKRRDVFLIKAYGQDKQHPEVMQDGVPDGADSVNEATHGCGIVAQWQQR